MNTNKIKSFAKDARIILLNGVKQRITYWGINENKKITEQVEPMEGGYMFRGEVFNDTTVFKKWERLKSAINKHSFEDILEEAAYTWFNRLIAIKILAKNNYIDPVYEYVSDELRDPIILQKARKGEVENLRDDEKKLLNQYLIESKDEEAFGLLLTAYCRNQKLLNRVFGHIDDYTELLLPTNLLTSEGIIELINDNEAIDEEDYKEVELIGWLYQFYISDKKDEVFAGFKKKKKARPEDIPAVTQIFTPKWIVKYMVENTVGRIWLDKYPASPIKSEMKYLVESQSSAGHCEESVIQSGVEEKDNEAIYKPLIHDVTQLTLLDPACGSGHILVVGFDLLMQMYKEEGYSTRNAVESIIKNNLFGLDIDDRAAQLANFAVLIKAASYYPEILKNDLMSNIYSFPEANNFTQGEIYKFLEEDAKKYAEELDWALKELNQGKNIGSALILNLEEETKKVIEKHFEILKTKAENDELDFEEQALYNKINSFIRIILVLTSKYYSVVANPPYLGRRNMNAEIKKYFDEGYPDTKSDLFGVFLEVFLEKCISLGRVSFINQWAWMCIDSYKNFRTNFIRKNRIESLLFLGIGVFPELNTKKVQNVALTFSKDKNPGRGKYYKLDENFNVLQKQKWFENRSNEYDFNQNKFLSIPESPISFWLPAKLYDVYKNGKTLKNIMNAKAGLQTGDNEYFVRYWFEVAFLNIYSQASNNVDAEESKAKWFPYDKGGGFRRWYGNLYFIVNWLNDGYAIKHSDGSTIRNEKYYFLESITWSLISLDFSARFSQNGSLFDVGGSSGFPAKQNISLILGLLNSKVSSYILSALNFTLNVQVGDINRILYINPNDKSRQRINILVSKLIELSKNEWDEFEISWSFKFNPLLKYGGMKIENCFIDYKNSILKNVLDFCEYECTLNKEFIEIYGLQNSLKINNELPKLTIYQNYFNSFPNFSSNFTNETISPLLKDHIVIKNLLSYAIGCIMGRYRLDKTGLNIAHPNPTEEETKVYKIKSPLHNGKKEIIFEIDEDGIIPVMGSDGNFSDDIVHRVKHFIEVVWGEATLTENINFIQQCLDQDLEEFLVYNFPSYHYKVYQKRPIYWLFQSETGAFQALVYMHRMNKFTVQKIRNNYLLKHLNYLRNEIGLLEKKESSLNKSEAKELDYLRSAEIECREYDKLLKDYADKQIEIDLDDGVKVNYAKFEDILTPI